MTNEGHLFTLGLNANTPKRYCRPNTKSIFVTAVTKDKQSLFNSQILVNVLGRKSFRTSRTNPTI